MNWWGSLWQFWVTVTTLQLSLPPSLQAAWAAGAETMQFLEVPKCPRLPWSASDGPTLPHCNSSQFLLRISALPRLWSISSFSPLSPLSLHSSVSHPQATEQEDVACLQPVPVMELSAHSRCLASSEDRQNRSVLSSPGRLTEPLFCRSVLYPDPSFTKLLGN